MVEVGEAGSQSEGKDLEDVDLDEGDGSAGGDDEDEI